MLPTNLFIVSLVLFLATTVSMAPVEEKEQEEVEVEATEEGELSEEEEDDDDSKSQDKIEGVAGERQTTTAAASGGSGVAAAMSSNIQDMSASSSQSAGGGGNYGTAGSSAGHGSESSMDSEAGVESSSTTQTGSDGVDSESNGNGQKLMNGGDVGGGADSQTGPLDSTVISSGVTAAQSVDKSSGFSLDSLSDPAYHSDISINQSGPDHSSLSSAPDQSHSSSFSVSGFSHFAVQGDVADSSSSSHSEAQRVQTDGADLPNTNGIGRQTLLTNTNGEVLVMSASGAESGLHTELTASGLGLQPNVTVSPLAVLHTDTLPSVSHGYSHTELVSMATDSTGTYTVSADPTGTPFDFSHPAVTDHTQMAGQVTEQYYPSGQGPEGTKNVELEDTC
nr:dentin sialophosphoprotein isoform X1 [Gasterosteus aculeatus aculeatus]